MHVSKLQEGTTEASLRKAFEVHGDIERVVIPAARAGGGPVRPHTRGATRVLEPGAGLRKRIVRILDVSTPQRTSPPYYLTACFIVSASAALCRNGQLGIPKRRLEPLDGSASLAFSRCRLYQLSLKTPPLSSLLLNSCVDCRPSLRLCTLRRARRRRRLQRWRR